MPTRYPIPPPSFWRLNTLNAERTQLFNQVHNPKALRLGNKILKMRFRAKAIENYYPQDFKFTPRKLARLFPGLTFQDEERERKLEWVEQYRPLANTVTLICVVRNGKAKERRQSISSICETQLTLSRTTKADFLKEQARAEERKCLPLL